MLMRRSSNTIVIAWCLLTFAYSQACSTGSHADSGKVLQTRCIAAIPCMSALPPCPLTGAQVTAANCCWRLSCWLCSRGCQVLMRSASTLNPINQQPDSRTKPRYALLQKAIRSFAPVHGICVNHSAESLELGPSKGPVCAVVSQRKAIFSSVCHADTNHCACLSG